MKLEFHMHENPFSSVGKSIFLGMKLKSLVENG